MAELERCGEGPGTTIPPGPLRLAGSGWQYALPCRRARPARSKTHTVNLRSIMIMSSRNLLCVIPEILYLHRDCLHCARSTDRAASSRRPPCCGFLPKSTLVSQWASKQSDKYCTLLLWVLTKLFALSNNAATSVSIATRPESFFSFDTSIQSRASSTNSLSISS